MAAPLAAIAPLVIDSADPGSCKEFLLDPTGGLRDISQATVRVLHKGSFADDPSRLFRAVRYVERLQFHFDLETLAAFMEAVKSGALATLSPRRILNEVLVSFDEPAPARVVEEFFERGLFFHLPLVSENNEELVVSALRRLEINRALVSIDDFRAAGRVIVLAGLLFDGREDLALATHEGGKAIALARRVLRQEVSLRSAPSVSEALANYCLHATVDARVVLEELMQRGIE
jgi:tRNA nucleotidyltransferase/poly(A) polymerase